MTYASFLQQGLPIGSGPVEATCKTIVQHRFCRSGMRWSIRGGQRIWRLVYKKGPSGEGLFGRIFLQKNLFFDALK